MNTSVLKARREFVDRTEAARLLGVSWKRMGLLADRGLVGVRRLPGCRTTYSVADLERLAREGMTPAVEGSAASHAVPGPAGAVN